MCFSTVVCSAPSIFDFRKKRLFLYTKNKLSGVHGCHILLAVTVFSFTCYEICHSLLLLIFMVALINKRKTTDIRVSYS